MNHSEFETLLKQALQQPAPDCEVGLQQTLQRAHAQTEHRPPRERIPFRRFLCKQVRYIGWPLWSVQGACLLLFNRLLIQPYDETFWTSPANVARLLFCLSVLVAMMALPLLHRSVKHRMQEIESASYFSSVRLLMAKLAVIGIGDALLLAGMFLTALVRTSMQAGSLTCCLLLPFLTMTAAALFLMGHCSSSAFWAGSLALGASLLLLAVGLPGRWLLPFPWDMTWGWAVCIGLLLAFSAAQLRHLLFRSAYTELQMS